MNYKITIGTVIAVVIIAIIAAALVFRGGAGTGAGSAVQQGIQTPQGTAVAPGASPVASSGQVIAPSGQPAKLDVTPSSPQAPQESDPVSANGIPSSAIKLTVTASGWSPSSFTVKSGAVVTLSITSGDSQTHIFMMDDPSLSALAVGVGPGETRVITFNAPKSGTYGFHCDVPGHAARGEVGKMIVE
ncbi:MAG TPA: cupredoxin domain-containing protein [Candidatus Paceibacterota bacterium]|nr:cupredoxin domain-containing protein [Candidatus Paceibacterota bacterium]